MTSYIPLGIIIALTFAAASTGGAFGPGPWYLSLNKPWWTPPGWVFPLVWTILYIMIAWAGYVVWQEQGLSLAMALWGVQLLFNGLWSYIMFGVKNISLALVDAGAMWLAIAAFMIAAWPVSPFATQLFIPYLVWATIAFVLNLEVLRMNPTA
jgi:translocator protein